MGYNIYVNNNYARFLRGKKLKKLLLFTIVFIISVCFFGCASGGNAGGATPPIGNSGEMRPSDGDYEAPSQGGLDNEASSQPSLAFSALSSLINSLEGEVGDKTTFRLTSSDGVSGYGYDVEFFQDKIQATLYMQDGDQFAKTKTYEATTYAEIKSSFAADFNVQDDNTFFEKTESVVFLTPNRLFNFTSDTVKYVYVKEDKSGNVTYSPYVYENRVKDALPCFDGEFESVSDVLNLKITVDAIGTKTQIALDMKAQYVGLNTPTDVTLSVIHTKTVKVIY